jgi:hypothetical protein
MARTTLRRELRALSHAMKQIAESFARLTPELVKAQVAARDGRYGAVPPEPARRRPTLSPKHRAALKLQGKYMGTMRGLKPAQRAAVKRVRAEKGIKAAINVAARLAG